jgi:N-carbamoylputrescine amidase
MSSLRVSFAQWPDGLQPGDSDWEKIVHLVQQERPDILVTNELPFGEWLACSNVYDPEQAQRSVDLHEEGIAALHGLRVPTIISTRPILSGDRLSNEAFALVQGEYLFLHQKHYFPEEPGFYESTWFTTGQQGFQVVEVNGVKVGALLCTELMFNEHARQYGRAGAELIVAPRAADADHHYWEVAASMAAVVSGAYVITANRTG